MVQDTRSCFTIIFVLVLALAVHGQGNHLEEDVLLENAESGSGQGEIDGVPEISTCTAEFATQLDHTMCKVDDERVQTFGVTERQKKVIVDYHNKVRRNAQPVATDLTNLIWDDNLAAVAQKLTMQCIIEHDKNRNIPSYGMFVGQNLAAGYPTWKKAMQSWFNEVQLYKYGQDANLYLGPGGWKKIGHYTQMVQNSTHRVGCGYARCTRTPYGRYYACNYAQGQSSTRYPYTVGQRCSACPNSCNKGLCECNGKLCLNGGKLDIDSCTCTCPSIYKGEDCSILNCPKSDQPYCRRSVLPHDCEVYANVPHLCPFMCGVCGATPSSLRVADFTNNNTPKTTTVAAATITTTTTTTTTPTPLYVSPHNCSYRGPRYTLEECKMFGESGSDTGACATKGGEFGCSHCKRYFNVKTQYCPVMCGICDAPCEGKMCKNGGALDRDTCNCTCIPPYYGETCEQIACPEADNEWPCKFYPQSYCTTYINVPYDCPHKCGLCF